MQDSEGNTINVSITEEANDIGTDEQHYGIDVSYEGASTFEYTDRLDQDELAVKLQEIAEGWLAEFGGKIKPLFNQIV